MTQSRHFTLTQVGTGIWAAIATPGTGSAGNAGIVDLGDRTLIFDTMQTPAAARDLARAATTLTGRAATWVVNSHMHGDHVRGNQVFPGATIFATAVTRDLIAQRGAGFLRMVRQPGAGEAYLRQMDEQVAAAVRDPARFRAMEWARASARELVAAVPEMEVCLPNAIFDQELTLHGTQRRAELRCWGGGHTASDAFLWLPDDGVLFAGDLAAVENHAAVIHGEIAGWIGMLDRLLELPVRALVTGHGPVAGQAELAVCRQYLVDLQVTAAAAIARGATPAEAAALPIPDAYAGWGAPSVWSENLEHLVRA